MSALLLGTTIAVPRGRDVGGAFQRIPLCHSVAQTGSSSRSCRSDRLCSLQPSRGLADNGQSYGGLHERGDARRRERPATRVFVECRASHHRNAAKTVGRARAPIDTPFVNVPGLLTARCTTNEHATYLEVTVHGSPADPRVDDIVGDIDAGGAPSASWGLHLIDMNLAMGNLLDIVGRQRERS